MQFGRQYIYANFCENNNAMGNIVVEILIVKMSEQMYPFKSRGRTEPPLKSESSGLTELSQMIILAIRQKNNPIITEFDLTLYHKHTYKEYFLSLLMFQIKIADGAFVRGRLSARKNCEAVMVGIC